MAYDFRQSPVVDQVGIEERVARLMYAIKRKQGSGTETCA